MTYNRPHQRPPCGGRGPGRLSVPAGQWRLSPDRAGPFGVDFATARCVPERRVFGPALSSGRAGADRESVHSLGFGGWGVVAGRSDTTRARHWCRPGTDRWLPRAGRTTVGVEITGRAESGSDRPSTGW